MKIRRFLLWTLGGLALIGIASALAFFPFPVTIHARNADDGGFTPNYIQARVGKPLHLRLVSDDVEHTFAIGQYSMEPVILESHQPVDVTLTFDRPGTYTFYSTTPSSLNFWRMRGTIEVTGDKSTPMVEPPLYVQLGLSLDDEHESGEGNIELARPPSAARGAALSSRIDPGYLTRDYYVYHSPMEAFEDLRVESTLSDEDVWDMVAYIWAQNTSTSALAEGQQLYQTNCAACHGESGMGDGQFADEMKTLAKQNTGDMGIEAPTDFSQPEHMLELKPAVVQGLILRGGMGTGMPMWGAIFTDDQMWDLVAYLYSFQIDYH
jgi:mono/diheme cytochrome c family protein/plastocyanin